MLGYTGDDFIMTALQSGKPVTFHIAESTKRNGTVNGSLKFNGTKIFIINTTGVLDFINIDMFFAVTKDLCHK